MDIKDLEVYNLSMKLGQEVWNIIIKWNNFEKQTLGSQWIRAVDSIAANISEGRGRYSFKDSRNFLIIARGSLFESKTWTTKAYERELISQEHFDYFTNSINRLGVKLNNFIKIHDKQINMKTT